MTIKVNAVPRESSSNWIRCPYCHDQVRNPNALHSCRQCQTRIHVECLEAAKCCPVCQHHDPIINDRWKTEEIADRFRRRRRRGRSELNPEYNPNDSQRLKFEITPGLGELICAVASFMIPGLGQLFQGRVLAAMGHFILAVVLLPFLVGLFMWPYSAYDALFNSPRLVRGRKIRDRVYRERRRR